MTQAAETDITQPITITLPSGDWLMLLAVIKEQAREFARAPWEIGDEQQVMQFARDLERIMREIALQAKGQEA